MDRTQLSQLAVFAAVAETGSFRAAADRLGIAHSAVSHAVSSLESRLGVRLLARTTRSTRPTQEGARLLAQTGGALHQIAEALAAVEHRDDSPSGPLRITMPVLAADDPFVARLIAFSAAFPQIELDVRTADRFEDIVESGFDAGIRLGESLEADMIAVRASGPLRGMVVGAPSWFAGRDIPQTPQDLAGHNCIRRRFDSGRIYRWEFEKDGRALNVEVQGNLILPQQEMIRRAALDGLGLAWLFEHTIADDLASGRLVAVLQDWCPPFAGFHIYYPSRRQMRPALRAFIDFFRHRD